MNSLKKLFFKDEQFITAKDCSTGDSPFDCVAVAITDDGVGIRSTLDDTKNTVVFNKEEWKNFIMAVRAGGFDV